HTLRSRQRLWRCDTNLMCCKEKRRSGLFSAPYIHAAGANAPVKVSILLKAPNLVRDFFNSVLHRRQSDAKIRFRKDLPVPVVNIDRSCALDEKRRDNTYAYFLIAHLANNTRRQFSRYHHTYGRRR